MATFDYGAAAELFSGAARSSRRQPMGYRRFASAAHALRFAIEDLTPEALAGAALEVGDQRFDCHDMRRLYEASEYPLARREPATKGRSDGTRGVAQTGRTAAPPGRAKKGSDPQHRD
jgi:hypothetical protein